MMDGAAMAASVLGAAADVVGRIIELVGRGKAEQAKAVADRFVATTQAQLDNDRGEADSVLRRRFPDSQPPGG